MLTRPQVMACGVEVVTIVFLIFADVDRMLTELTVICLTLACAVVDNLKAVAHPVADRLMTSCIVHARIADAFVHVDIAVATEGRVVRVVIAFHDSTLGLVLEHE